MCQNCLERMKKEVPEHSKAMDSNVSTESEVSEAAKSTEMEITMSSESEVSEQPSGDMDTDEEISIPAIEISSVNECLQALGESPLKPISKATPHYSKQKIQKVHSTLKRKILDLSQRGEEEVRFC